jgi:flagellar motor protein MotB
MARIALLLVVSLSILPGCRQPMGGTGAQGTMLGNNLPWSQNSGNLFANQGLFQQPNMPQVDPAQMQQLASQVQSLNQRLGQFNSDNDNLNAQIAALQQRLGTANSYNDSLRQQLADTMAQLQQSQTQNQQITAAAQQQIAQAMQQGQGGAAGLDPYRNASAGGAATIRANNGLMQRLNSVQVPGFRTWMDGDVIRIEGPTDRLFVSGSYQINQNDASAISSLAQTIRQNFPQQVISVEAHWDGSPVQPATMSHHQLTANHALAVLDLLVKGGLPNSRVFTMAMGSNRPRYNSGAQNGVSPNRRIEIVIYPEMYR